MAKQYKVLVNTGKAENNKAVDVQQFSGDKGQPVRIKAQGGAKYELQEITRGKPVGPDYIKARRVGKDLHILFEDEREASLIIEGYYSEMAPGYNGVIGQAENGSFYDTSPKTRVCRASFLSWPRADGRSTWPWVVLKSRLSGPLWAYWLSTP